MKSSKVRLLSSVMVMAGAAQVSPVLAQSAPQVPDKTEQTRAEGPVDQATASDDIVVTADRVGLLEKRPSETLFGLGKPLIETPRAATVASATTLDRYGIRSVTDLVAVSPGAGTASWFGIPGSVNLRGTMSDNYYRGFARLPNFATYATPLGGAASVEIVRGPPSPIYGPGKVGGFVNYNPKTAQTASGGYINDWTGALTLSGGSYAKKNLTAMLGAPVTLGTVHGGITGYVEADDSHSYFKGIRPSYQLYQLDASFDLGNGFSFEASGMVYHARGFLQVFTNRLTQDLVDHGTYITGRDTTVVDLDGNGRLTPNETSPKSFHIQWSGVGVAPITARGTLDTGVGTTTISTRDVSVSNRDFNHTTTQTYTADLSKTFDNGAKISFDYFRDKLKNDRYFSYGFPGHYRANAQELRLTYKLPIALSDNFKIDTVSGVQYRWVSSVKAESYAGGFVSVDRRDIAFGATATDIFDDPFSMEPGNIGQPFETYVSSKTSDAGAFTVIDANAFKDFDLLLSGRVDSLGVNAKDDGTIVFSPAVRGQYYGASRTAWSYNASLTYHSPIGLIPYGTRAESTSLELNQAGDIQPGQVINRNWFSKSDLWEGGVKFDLLRSTLVGSLAYYDQTRTRNDVLTNAQVKSHSYGLEFEFRYVINKNFSLNGSANRQRTYILGDNTTTYIPPVIAGVPYTSGYGVNYRVTYAVLYPGLKYEYTLIPKTIASLFGSFTSNRYEWGSVGATLGVVYTGPTRTLLPTNYVNFHSHTLANLSVYYEKGRYSLAGNVTNLFDKRYYQPATDTTANVITIPGAGREWRITAGYKF